MNMNGMNEQFIQFINDSQENKSVTIYNMAWYIDLHLIGLYGDYILNRTADGFYNIILMNGCEYHLLCCMPTADGIAECFLNNYVAGI